ncbi:MAG: F0F1 ATP synthase subunit B [Myxococcaceae bacterium]
MPYPLLLAASGLTEVRPGLIFWTLVTFTLAALILRQRAWGPILRAVKERESQIAQAIEAAKRERAEAEKLLAEQKSAIAEARREAAELMRKNQADVERFRDELMAKARSEAEAAKADAKRAIDDERLKAVAEVKALAADLAVDIATKLLGNEMNGERQRQLAEQFLEQLPRPGAVTQRVA